MARYFPSQMGPNKGGASEEPGIREIALGMQAARNSRISVSSVSIGGKSYASNVVKTSKYTLATFLPLNLFEQLHKSANVYFLLISIAMFVGEQTSLYMEAIKAYSTFLTLVAMMAVSAASAALDDYRRHKADVQMNSQEAAIVGEGGVEKTVTWAEVKVGDTLIVRSDQEVPADLVLLASSGEEGGCYVSTANLDGETNLKPKAPLRDTQAALCPVRSASDGSGGARQLLVAALGRLSGGLGGLVRAEPPQTSIHTFTGSLRLGTDPERALGPKQLLLRGTRLRNTAWCLGIVVYTGRETRVVMNSRHSQPKLANIERVINISMLVVLFAQGAMALITVIMYSIERDVFRSYWYLFRPGSGAGIILPEPIGYWITFFILYSNLMPISLYATVEVCNKAQAYFISNDLAMYDEEFDVAAIVRSTNLCHELGQVEYVFSDKTGTLTQNIMELKRLYIAGEVYGQLSEERGFNGSAAVREASLKDAQRAQSIAAALEVLAVCHTVVAVRPDEAEAGAEAGAAGGDAQVCPKYEAESPDEDALVTATATLGWTFLGRSGPKLKVDVQSAAGQNGEALGSRSTLGYTVLAVNAFSSARKRMSVLVVNEAGEHLLLAKGADNVMLERATTRDPQLLSELNTFARQGLRTLVLARRTLTPEEAREWLVVYEAAQCSLKDREGALEAAAEAIETRLHLVGATAIEDKLQAGVSQTIARLRTGGIKLWMLTGDKLETAKNIGYSTNVLSDGMEVLTLETILGENVVEIEEKLRNLDMSLNKAQGDRIEVGLMVTGQALEAITHFSLQAQLLAIAVRCSVVIACRVSPLQKAELVRLVRVRVKPQPVTLAVGDGANDVPMIHEAQVGIGICGREGRQAVNAADFAIGQFRFLQRLLLVHGRYNYKRTCKFTLYTFWRNAVQVLLMFYYSFLSGYSGISLFEDKVRMTYNFILAIPIVSTGIFDRDVKEEVALEHPVLYEVGRRGRELGPSRMAGSLLSALVHSAVIFAVCLLGQPGMDVHNAGDYYSFGTTVYSVLIVDGSLRVAFLTSTWNWFSLLSILLALAGYVVFLVVYGAWEALGPWMYGVPGHMAANGAFWVCLLVGPALATVVDFAVAFVWLEFWPDTRKLVLETRETSTTVLDDGAVARPAVPPALVGKRSAGDKVELLSGEGEANQATASGTAACASSGGGTTAAEGIAQSNRPSKSRFAQERLPARHFEVTQRRAIVAAVAGAALLIVLGAVALSLSRSAAQLRVRYDGPRELPWPAGTLAEEVTHSECKTSAGSGNTTSCLVSVTVATDMAPPILVYYVIGPFYQNYNSYVLNVVDSELSGAVATESGRAKCKETGTDEDASGQLLVPCGLRATSLFNDTFDVLGVDVDKAGIAWDSDVSRFANPPNFPGAADTSWLFERYPTVISQGTNTLDEDFVAWMRPGGTPWIRKHYGFLRTPLQAGQTVTLRINASYPLPAPDTTKEVVLTTTTGMGARDDGLALFLLSAGSTCLFAAALMLAMRTLCWRRPGDRRWGARLPPSLASVAVEVDLGP